VKEEALVELSSPIVSDSVGLESDEVVDIELLGSLVWVVVGGLESVDG